MKIKPEKIYLDKRMKINNALRKAMIQYQLKHNLEYIDTGELIYCWNDEWIQIEKVI